MTFNNLRKQNKSGQCGVYNLANLVQDKDILAYADDKTYLPCGLYEVNKILKNEGYPFKFEFIVATSMYNEPIPEDFAIRIFEEYRNTISNVVEKKVKKDGYFIPFILSVQLGNNKKSLHATTLIWHNGQWILTDPASTTFYKINDLKQLFETYKMITQIAIPNAPEGGFSGLLTTIWGNEA